jgi:hypothetical protein
LVQGIIATRIDDGSPRFPQNPPVPLSFRRPAQQKETQLGIPSQCLDKLQEPFLGPGLVGEYRTGPRIEADDRFVRRQFFPSGKIFGKGLVIGLEKEKIFIILIIQLGHLEDDLRIGLLIMTKLQLIRNSQGEGIFTGPVQRDKVSLRTQSKPPFLSAPGFRGQGGSAWFFFQPQHKIEGLQVERQEGSKVEDP